MIYSFWKLSDYISKLDDEMLEYVEKFKTITL